MAHNVKRPVFLNLFQIRMPVAAVLSIFHRASGVLMVLAFPLLLYLLELSMQSEQGFATVSAWLSLPIAKMVSVILFWAFVHHLLSGIRFLLIDLEIGLERSQARRSAWMIHAITAVLSLYFIVSIL